ncbi:MAG: Peptidase family [Solirubrobacteraceae bacterium]|nr:Peptidase family [Solirubrobacteraceae bacterium]
MPAPRHRALTATATAVAVVLACAVAAPAAAGGAWRLPVDGDVVAGFAYAAGDPFAGGQRRGIDIAAPPGAPVRSACRGRVTFAGRLPRGGLGVTVRCGGLAATHLGLGRLAAGARRGARVGAGARLGALGPGGRLRRGARDAARRFGYVDPLALLRGARPPGAPAVPLGPAPRGPAVPAPRPATSRTPRLAPPVAGGRRAPAVPALAWAGLVLLAAGVPLGGVVARSRRRRGATARRAAPEAR